MTMLKTTKYFTVLVLLSSCWGKKSVDRYNWVIGNWRGHEQEIQYFENWKKSNEETLSGDSYVYQNGDTVFREKNKIELIGGTACYILSLPETKEPLIYKLIEEDGQKIVFENKEHEFPQVITYEMKGDSLHVVSLGTADKQKVKEEAYFHKK